MNAVFSVRNEIKMEEQNINEEATPKAGKKGLGGLLGKIDSAGESGLRRILFNLPFLFFLVLLAALHIANNNMAENYARNIVHTEKDVKQLRWQYMTTASALMLKSKQSEVAKLVDAQGLKELRIPPYKIETEK